MAVVECNVYLSLLSIFAPLNSKYNQFFHLMNVTFVLFFPSIINRNK